MRLLLALALFASFQSASADSLAPAAQVDTPAQITDLLARSRYEDAHEAALRWHESEPDNARAAYWVGNTAGQLAMRSGMFSAMGLAKTSRKALERAVELDPEDLEAQFALMQYYVMAPGMMGGDADEAKAIAARINQASRVEGLRADAQLRLSLEKDRAGWLRAQEQVLGLDPAQRDALAAVVADRLGRSDHEGAKTLIDAARAADPASVPVRYQFVKWAAVSGRELEAALAEVDALIAAQPYPERFTLSGAHYRRGQLLAKLGRKTDAIAALEAALSVEPEFEAAETELEQLRGG